MDHRAPTDGVILAIISAARILRRLAILEYTTNNATEFNNTMEILLILTRTRKFYHRNKLDNKVIRNWKLNVSPLSIDSYPIWESYVGNALFGNPDASPHVLVQSTGSTLLQETETIWTDQRNRTYIV